jgi:hypothetical protein
MENNKSVFKTGDKVYDYLFGWGVVINVYNGYSDYPVHVEYTSVDTRYTFDGRYFDRLSPTLSFTEYTLEGFSQERTEELPEKGDIVWVRDDEDDSWLVTQFVKKDNDMYLCTDENPFLESDYSAEWNQMTTKNPYKKDGE